ncbi:hypothetical protein LIER_20036 [Lithospermum erythrorhizon]|uniref:Uncharacterized protein n=1 Tax=Lithospermum erythrorhizon TaxID=34254 RepID=A0AAV3QK25_LITER
MQSRIKYLHVLPFSARSYDNARTSIIPDFSLQCVSSSMITGLPTSCFFMGCLLGGLILSHFRDSFGENQCFLCPVSLCLSLQFVVLFVTTFGVTQLQDSSVDLVWLELEQVLWFWEESVLVRNGKGELGSFHYSCPV